MNTQMHMEALEVMRNFIRTELEDMGQDWWEEFVLVYIAHRNKDRARSMGQKYFTQMDLAETLHVLIGNWRMISERHLLDQRYFWVIQHLLKARHAYAHPSTASGSEWDVYDQKALDLIKNMIDGNQLATST